MSMPRSPRSPRSPSSSHFSTAQQHLPLQARRPSVSPRSTSSPTVPTFRNMQLSSPSSPQRSQTNPHHVPHPMSPLSQVGPRTPALRTRPPLLTRRTTTAGLLLPSMRSASSGRPRSPNEQMDVPSSPRVPGSRRASLTHSICSTVSSTGGSNGRGGGGPVPPSLLRGGGGVRWLPPSSTGIESHDGLGSKVKGWRTEVATHQLQGYNQLALPSPAPSFSSRISPPARPVSQASSRHLSRAGSANSSSSNGSRLSVRVASSSSSSLGPPETEVYGFHLLPSPGAPGAPTEDVWKGGEHA